MSLPTMNGTARLIDDPELRFGAGSGKAVVKVRLAFNSRKKDPASGEWVDDASFFIDGKAFDRAAENIAESLQRGLEVVVSGRLKTESWEDRQTGDKRSKAVLLIDSIGPALRSATAKVSKASSSSGQQAYAQARQAQGQASVQDPWSSSTPGGQPAGGWDQEPPF